MITWDPKKADTNRRKHGVSFELAALAFDDPLHLTRQERIENGEQRWQTLGMANGVLLLLVAHTWQADDSGEEYIRIVSARKADRTEKRIYEQGA